MINTNLKKINEVIKKIDELISTKIFITKYQNYQGLSHNLFINIYVNIVYSLIYSTIHLYSCMKNKDFSSHGFI